MKPPVSIRWTSDNHAHALQVTVRYINFSGSAPWSKPMTVKIQPKLPRKRK